MTKSKEQDVYYKGAGNTKLERERESEKGMQVAQRVHVAEKK